MSRDLLLDARRRDAVGLVIVLLLLAAAIGLGNGALHRAGDVIGIENNLAVDIAGGAANRLDQRRLGAQEAFLVGIEDGDEGAFGNIEAFAQEVDADSTSKAPSRRSRMISIRSSVSMSECM